MKSTVWVVGAGDEDLVPHMIKDGLMFIGPGKAGDISSSSKDDIKKICGSKKRCKDTTALHSFKARAEKEQIVVARLGSVCFVVGSIKSDYRFSTAHGSIKYLTRKKPSMKKSVLMSPC